LKIFRGLYYGIYVELNVQVSIYADVFVIFKKANNCTAVRWSIDWTKPFSRLFYKCRLAFVLPSMESCRYIQMFQWSKCSNPEHGRSIYQCL